MTRTPGKRNRTSTTRNRKRNNEAPGWYWRTRIVLDTVRTGATIAICWLWNLVFDRS